MKKSRPPECPGCCPIACTAGLSWADIRADYLRLLLVNAEAAAAQVALIDAGPKFEQAPTVGICHLTARRLPLRPRMLEWLIPDGEEFFVSYFKEALAEANALVSEAGLPVPGDSCDAWMHLARMAGKDPVAEELTLAETVVWALAWADRERFRIKLEREAHVPRAAPSPSPRAPDSGRSFGWNGKEDLERVLAILGAHPDWNDSRVAEALGTSKNTFLRWLRRPCAKVALSAWEALGHVVGRPRKRSVQSQDGSPRPRKRRQAGDYPNAGYKDRHGAFDAYRREPN